MSGPDPGDSDDDGPGDDAPTHRDNPSSDGAETPDETQTTERSTEPTDGPSRDGNDAPTARRDDTDSSTGHSQSEITIEDDGLVRWFLKTDNGTVVFARDLLSSVAIVAVIGLLLFGLSGVFPPLVAVESGSMEPNMERGDLIFVVDSERFVGDDPIEGTGVVPLENGEQSDHEKFNEAGDVIVFKPDGSDYQTPVIHRAHFWVEAGENWVDTKAAEAYVGGASCEEVRTCPAEHDGFITKGDANSGYDQHQGGARTDVVKPEWVSGKAMFRVPYLGHVRLTFDAILGGIVTPSPSVGDAVAGADVGPGHPSAAIGVGATAAVGASGIAAVAVRRRRF